MTDEHSIDIVDYKSDLDLANLDQYKIQLSCYYHVIKDFYPDKKINLKIFFVCLDKIEDIGPLQKEELLSIALSKG